MSLFVSMYLFVLGAVLGSFMLVVVDRMKHGKSWVKGRSECTFCHRQLRATDLVPIFSWLSTKGKCRYCHKKLSVAYPFVELGLGVAFVVSYLSWPMELSTTLEYAKFIIWLVGLCIMAGLFVFDIRWYLLPNKLVYPLIVLGLFWAASNFYTEGLSFGLAGAYALALLISSGFFLALYVVSRGDWIGDGDIRLGAAIGLFLGSWQLAWLTIFLASVIGIVASLPLLLRIKHKKNKLKLKIPFGPMLLIGFYISFLYGQRIIDWMLQDIFLL